MTDQLPGGTTATVGGVTLLLALFTGVGLTGDRLAMVLNGGTARGVLMVALVSAVVSIAFGLSAVIWSNRRLAVVAIFALVLSQGFGVWAASMAFSDGGRPTLTKVSVVPEGDTHATLSFTVTADGVKMDNLLRAFALWVPNTTTLPPGQTPQQKPPFYIATLRPNDKGVVSQEVSVLVVRPVSAQTIRLQVYWDSLASIQPTSTTGPTTAITEAVIPPPIQLPAPVGALCGNQANAREAAACVEVEVEAAVTATSTAGT